MTGEILLSPEYERKGDSLVPIWPRICPWKNIPNWVFGVDDLYGHYKDGFLLNDGGVADQYSWYLDAMELFKAEANRIMNEKLKPKDG